MPCLNNIGKGSNTEIRIFLRDIEIAEVEKMLSCKDEK